MQRWNYVVTWRKWGGVGAEAGGGGGRHFGGGAMARQSGSVTLKVDSLSLLETNI